MMNKLDLTSKMEVILDGSEYSPIAKCSKLIEYFGNQIVITHINGKSNVVTYC